MANVIPIFKLGENTRVNNYRPVSVLPVISKILERLMYDRLLNFLNKHKFFYTNHFGFQKKHSIYMALLTLVDQISNALENGNSVIGIFLDFSKAFDTVDHEIILMKLEYNGIRGVPLQWFTNYIQGRQQFATFNGVQS